MPAGVPPPLEVRNLVKRYGDLAAVDGVSFTVKPGSVFCLLGPNGAGKTTSLEVAQGIRRATSGEVRLFGTPVQDVGRDVKRRLGVLPQRFTGFPTLTVEENVRYFADVYNVDPDIPALLESLGLTDDADSRFRTLSGGTMRRVAIATTLVSDPDLVFLDEPTAGVDPANRRRLWDIIRKIRADGRSIVLTTHYMDEAERLADEVAILARGRIVARGTPEEVRNAHGGGAVVRVTGLQDPLPDALASRQDVRRDDEGAVLVDLPDATEGPLLISELVKLGVSYREISIREPTLDDAFVRLADQEGA